MRKGMAWFLGALLVAAGCNFSGFPAVGTKATPSDNKILSDGVTGPDLCTLEPFTDGVLHRTTLKQALESHTPVVVMFGTPQHCTQCVDQIRRLTALAEKYQGSVAFIHIDAYKDTRIIREWLIKGEPWTGLIDRDGVIRFVFHGPTLDQEIEPKIQELL